MMQKRIARTLFVGSLIASMAVPAAPAAAADVTDVPVFTRGSKMRLTTLDHSRMQGYLLEADGEQLRIRTRDGGERSVPFSELVAVEVARRNRRLRGAALGAVAGGALLGSIGVLGWAGDSVAERSPDGTTCYSTSAFLGTTYAYQCTKGKDVLAIAASGAVIGGLIGLWKTGERFVSVDPARAAVTVVPVPKGVAVRAAVSF
jgi:hypothetical protein